MFYSLVSIIFSNVFYSLFFLSSSFLHLCSRILSFFFYFLSYSKSYLHSTILTCKLDSRSIFYPFVDLHLYPLSSILYPFLLFLDPSFSGSYPILSSILTLSLPCPVLSYPIDPILFSPISPKNQRKRRD